MVKFTIPILLVVISVALFFTFTNPWYQEVTNLKTLSASYDEALSNSKALETERDTLTVKYNTINPSDIKRLEKLMPDSVDNIRLILEIEKLALPYGMVLTDVEYDGSEGKEEDTQGANRSAFQAGASRLPYGVWNLGFSTEGTYDNFVNFIKDLENNLRIVDVVSIEFSSEEVKDVKGLDLSLPQAYKYDFNIQTYWLKN